MSDDTPDDVKTIQLVLQYRLGQKVAAVIAAFRRERA